MGHKAERRFSEAEEPLMPYGLRKRTVLLVETKLLKLAIIFESLTIIILAAACIHLLIRMQSMRPNIPHQVYCTSTGQTTRILHPPFFTDTGLIRNSTS